MRALGFVLLAGCFSPDLQPGRPCSPLGECPSGFECSLDNKCEFPSNGGDASIGAPPPNDLPGGAIDVTGGGTFIVDLTGAHDDASAGVASRCDGNGRDAFYTITVAAAEVYYFDTFGSPVDTALFVYPGPCQAVTPFDSPCNDDSCGVGMSQLAERLSAGENCLVVDQPDRNANAGEVVLHVEPGGRDGDRASGVGLITGTTCGDPKLWTGACGGLGNDRGFYFTVCPAANNSLTASTCGAAFDTALHVRRPNAYEVACVNKTDGCGDGAILTTTDLPGPQLYWLVLDGEKDSDCGTFRLDYTLR